MAELIYNLANWLPLGYAFGAGMVATVNPCGFLMLPAYVAYYLGSGEDNPRLYSLPTRTLQGLSLALAMALGFVALFSAIGLAVSLGGQALLAPVPAAGLAIGAALAGLGLLLLFRGGSIGLAVASRVQVGFRRSLPFALLFGVGYAVASLSCTLPVFLLVVGSAMATQGLAPALLQFVSYSLGMGFLVAVVIVSTAFFKGALNRYLRQLMPYVHQVSAVFLIGAGAYLIIYWLRFGALF